MKVLVIGASRGIGLEFVRQYRADGAEVTATARDDAGLATACAASAHVAIASRRRRRRQRLGPGLADRRRRLRRRHRATPASTARGTGLAPPTDADFDTVMRTNVLGPMRVYAAARRRARAGGALAVLSSRMGSIGSRRAPAAGSTAPRRRRSTRSPRTSSLAWRGRAVFVSLHPGWVRTDMAVGGPTATSPHAARRRRVGETFAWRLRLADGRSIRDPSRTPRSTTHDPLHHDVAAARPPATRA